MRRTFKYGGDVEKQYRQGFRKKDNIMSEEFAPCFDLRYFHGTFNGSLNAPFAKLLTAAIRRVKNRDSEVEGLAVVLERVVKGDVGGVTTGFSVTPFAGNFYVATTREFASKLLATVDASQHKDGLEPALFALAEKLEERLRPARNSHRPVPNRGGRTDSRQPIEPGQ